VFSSMTDTIGQAGLEKLAPGRGLEGRNTDKLGQCSLGDFDSRPKSSFLPESDASSDDDMDSHDLRDVNKEQVAPGNLREKSKLSQFKGEDLGKPRSQNSLRSVDEKISDTQECPVMPDSEIERMANPRYGRRNAVAAGGLPFKKLMQMRLVTNAKLPADSKLIRDLLAKCPLFSGLTHKDLLLIPPMLKPENFSKGDAILALHSTSSNFFIVKQGTLSAPTPRPTPPAKFSA
jgi:hypothetical protein